VLLMQMVIVRLGAPYCVTALERMEFLLIELRRFRWLHQINQFLSRIGNFNNPPSGSGRILTTSELMLLIFLVCLVREIQTLQAASMDIGLHYATGLIMIHLMELEVSGANKDKDYEDGSLAGYGESLPPSNGTGVRKNDTSAGLQVNCITQLTINRIKESNYETLIILVVVIAIVKIGSASADDQNKQLATTNNQIPALTNHEG